MDKDPRLVARSETGRGTERTRPDSAHPIDGRPLQWSPRLDVDDLIRTRDVELESGMRWRVRIDSEELWWDSIGGYTGYSANAEKWSSRWDAYNAMIQQRTGERRWEIERLERPHTARGLAGGARRSELAQAWTRALLERPGGRAVPGDGFVHALVGDNVPGRALCGEEVGYWAGPSWPPRGMHRCEKCNSLALVLPD